MNWADYGIAAIIVISVVVSLLRGFIREAFSLVAWIGAFWIALVFAGDAGELLSGTISLPSARIAVAFAGLFLSVLAVGALVSFLLGEIVQKTGLGGTDRMLGVLFGLARGIAIVTLLVLFAGLTPLPGDPWWQESILLGQFEDLALWVRGWLPDEVAKYIEFAKLAGGG